MPTLVVKSFPKETDQFSKESARALCNKRTASFESSVAYFFYANTEENMTDAAL